MTAPHKTPLVAIVLLATACGATVQPSHGLGPPSPSPTAIRSAPASLAPVASDDGFLSGLDAVALTKEAEAHGLKCEEYTSTDNPMQQVWSCSGVVADGSELLMHAGGPDRTRIETASAEVLEYGVVKMKTIADFLGDMSALFSQADGAQARSWLVAAVPDAQRDGYAETNIGGSYFQLTFEDTGASSATFLSVSPAAGPPASSTPGPVPSGSGAAYFGELQGRPGGWVTFAEPGGKFTIAFPGQPTAKGPATTASADGPTSSTTYEWASKDRETSYAIVATDYEQGSLSGKEPGVVLDAAADRYRAAFGADPVARSATKIGPYFAMDVLETNTKGYICLRFVAVGDRLYALAGFATSRCPSDMAGFVGSLSLRDG